ncbi:hypothetical protein M9H77_08897 [Catharanthus roseus]|uniref:Uncharacterized protein n=1 Tax=Catharanthus roseus TaxID=4058 RepID=A0ACC0BZ00_CATRO|nr:hypothetical protein M9H77_08897 [Catharanthus roseus]
MDLKALQQGLGKHPVEAYCDKIGVVKKSASHTLDNIEKWMAPRKIALSVEKTTMYNVSTLWSYALSVLEAIESWSKFAIDRGPLPWLLFPSKAEVLPEPLGVL